MLFNAHAVQYAAAIFFGLMIGSFMTVVVHRLPLMLERMWQTELRILLTNHANGYDAIEHGGAEVNLPIDSKLQTNFKRYNLWKPRSCCPLCHHPLTVWQNLPLISYILLQGRCAFCLAPISIRYPALELLSACLAAAALWRFDASWQALAAFGLAATLLALAFIDMTTYLLPDMMTLPLLWSGLMVNLVAPFIPLHSAVIGAAAGYIFLWLVYWVFRLLWKEEGMGYGDFKLLAALGAWLGWAALPQIVLFASTVGALFGLMRLMLGQAKDRRLPFGPFLAIAGIITLFYVP